MNIEKYNFLKEYIKNYDAKLLVVTKNQSIETIKDLINLGHKEFGENRVQEAKNKFKNISNLKLHLIGSLQSNKVRDALDSFDVIQSVDREKLVLEIIKHYTPYTRTKEFYIQINIGSEPQKSGVHVDKVKDFYNFCLNNNLNVVGLMCIPPKQNVEKFFSKMVDLKENLNNRLLLSMGMSGDFKLALQYKTDLIRVGSYIFNE